MVASAGYTRVRFFLLNLLFTITFSPLDLLLISFHAVYKRNGSLQRRTGRRPSVVQKSLPVDQYLATQGRRLMGPILYRPRRPVYHMKVLRERKERLPQMMTLHISRRWMRCDAYSTLMEVSLLPNSVLSGT